MSRPSVRPRPSSLPIKVIDLENVANQICQEWFLREQTFIGNRKEHPQRMSDFFETFFEYPYLIFYLSNQYFVILHYLKTTYLP